MPQYAVATFVKTPGISPLKTRLGKKFGDDNAVEFYKRSVKCIEEVLLQIDLPITPFWALAENQTQPHKLWDKFETINQGDGCLGQRLATVYNQLLSHYDGVFLIGGDLPQINSEHFKQAISALENNRFLLGPSKDGGFYIFGGQAVIPKSLWTSITYSEKNTAEKLVECFSSIKKFSYLEELQDIDEIEDLQNVTNEYRENNLVILNPKQKELFRWASEQLGLI